MNSDLRKERHDARSRQIRARRRLAGLVIVAGLIAVVAVIGVSVGNSGGGDHSRSTARHSSGHRTSGSATKAQLLSAVTSQAPGAHRAPSEPVPILMYHVIGYWKPGIPNAALWVHPKDFAVQMRALKNAGYHAITLQAAWEAWHRKGLLPSKPVVISFDDGYFGQFRNAMPTLRSLRWPGVLNLKLDSIKDMGGAGNLRKMIDNGWEIDSHTISHPDLTKVGAAQLRTELFASRARLKKSLGVPVNFFCYPAGRFDANVVAEVKAAGYLGATTTQTGFARPQDTYTMARVRILNTDTPATLLAELRTLGSHPQAPPSGTAGD